VNKPTPGSKEAGQQGCLCPVVDNNHGKGCGRVDSDGKPMFWINADCPMHGVAAVGEADEEGE